MVREMTGRPEGTGRNEGKPEWKNKKRNRQKSKQRYKQKCRQKYGRKSRTGFGKIWLITALPILSVTAIAMIALSGLILTALVIQENLWVSEIAYETTLLLKEKDLESLEDNYEVSGTFNLERSQMVAVLYDETGNLLCQSDVKGYGNWHDISAANYEILLERLKEIPMTDRRENAGIENADVYGVSFLYGRKYFTVDDKTYTLRYGALISPWNRHGRKFLVGGSMILLCMCLLASVIAGYYYRIYRERMKAEEYYRNTSNALAHDLKTPLMAISGYAEILQENVHMEKRNYYAEGILKNVLLMDSIIENMLELGKLENPEIILVKKEINLQKMTEEILERFQVEIQSKELKVQVQETDSPVIRADETLMKRALENLISNAVKYTPEDEKIIITMDMNEYSIENTGVMIPKEKLAHVWEPFVKGENARAKVTGTGIGLTIVKEILDLHGFSYELKNGENSVRAAIYFRR